MSAWRGRMPRLAVATAALLGLGVGLTLHAGPGGFASSFGPPTIAIQEGAVDCTSAAAHIVTGLGSGKATLTLRNASRGNPVYIGRGRLEALTPHSGMLLHAGATTTSEFKFTALGPEDVFCVTDEDAGLVRVKWLREFH